jgi:predicted short-subunit dehydrogenase-like oxidoreductase (DUF2520 family)
LDRASTRIGFIGSGKLAGALAPLLAEAGYRVELVSSRSAASAETLAQRIAGAVASTVARVADDADLVFITTPDAAIRAVAASVRWRPGQAVVHTSGVESSEALAAAAEQGALVGSFHPLQTFADAETARAILPGSLFAIEAEGPLRDFLGEVAESLGGSTIYLRPEDKAIYHAAAVLVSNYSVLLMKVAADLWLRLGIDRQTALAGLLPLLRGTVRNLESLGLPAALTGPISRGDVVTVERHLAALNEAAPEVASLYKELGLHTIPLALGRGGLEGEAAVHLRRLFAGERQSVSPGGANQES